jgi:hypothetical protein
MSLYLEVGEVGKWVRINLYTYFFFKDDDTRLKAKAGKNTNDNNIK